MFETSLSLSSSKLLLLLLIQNLSSPKATPGASKVHCTRRASLETKIFSFSPILSKMATSLSYFQQEQNNSPGGCFQQCVSLGNGNDASSPLNFLPFNSQNNALGHQEMKTSEDLLASELSKLSVQERSNALDDLHCVGQELKDTPEVIDNALFHLDGILKERMDPIYQIALQQNRTYVEDVNFRLRFLRANHHDAAKAANQMIAFLNQKEIYFGRDTLARDITLDDLNEEDKQVLLNGRFHIQNAVDRNGRVVVYFLNHGLHLSNESVVSENAHLGCSMIQI